ncbi:hypothetical protein Tcan_17529 [Toxocara canis]|uniref:Uncharacterized protein n=1 Tax=Toxocara canis TaxID=6265 RepID=A0A0B2UXU6_TOXCA|nr:hypothetical protein Tcan_17529 [Toxocara canis]
MNTAALSLSLLIIFVLNMDTVSSSLRFKRHWGWDQYYYNGRYGHRRWHYGYDRYMDRGMGGHIGGGSNNNYGGTTIDRLYNYNINL